MEIRNWPQRVLIEYFWELGVLEERRPHHTWTMKYALIDDLIELRK